jgi:hypothetical protein
VLKDPKNADREYIDSELVLEKKDNEKSTRYVLKIVLGEILGAATTKNR